MLPKPRLLAARGAGERRHVRGTIGREFSGDKENPLAGARLSQFKRAPGELLHVPRARSFPFLHSSDTESALAVTHRLGRDSKSRGLPRGIPAVLSTDFCAERRKVEEYIIYARICKFCEILNFLS